MIRYSALGDIILTTGPLIELKKQRGDVEVHLLTDSVGASLLRGQSFVDQVHVVPPKASALKFIQLVKVMGAFDRVIDLQAKPKTMALHFLFGKRYFRVKKQSRKRRAFVKSRRFADHLNGHVVGKYFAVFEQAMGLAPRTEEDLKPKLSAKGPAPLVKTEELKNSIAIHPYASQSNKVWPYLEELVTLLLINGHSVVVLGRDEGLFPLKQHDKLYNLTNQTSVPEMAFVLSKARGFISTDSGPMHLGIAVGVPTMAIFGPTTKEFGFYPRFSGTAVIENDDLECRPCHVHGGNTCPLGHHRCMKDIRPEDVYKRLSSILESES